MKLSRERQVLIAVAGLAALGVAADRVLLNGAVSGPQEAAAQTAPPTSVAAADETAASEPAAATPRGPVESLAQRLERARPQVLPGRRNAFANPEGWDATTNNRPRAAAEEFDPEAFVRNHPLEAITLRADQRSAVIAGDVLHLGDEREGMTLSAIDAGFVIWSGHGMRVRARLHPR